METDIPEEWKQYPLASDFIEYEFNKVYLRKGRDGILMPWTWSRNGRTRNGKLWKRGIWGQKLRSWKKLLEEKAKEKNIEIISIIIRQGRNCAIGDEIMFADIKKIPNGRCMCKFKCPCGIIDIKIVRDLCYGAAYFECHNCSNQQKKKAIQASQLNFSDDKKADIQKKKEETCMKNSGYRNPFKNPETRAKAKATYRERTGFVNPSQNPEVKGKKVATHRERTGFNYPFQDPEVQELSRQTWQTKYNADHPMQNAEIARKCASSMNRTKIYKYPSGREDKVEGYEPQCLNDLIHNEGICEKDIITDRMKVPEIWWEDEGGVRHRHYVDIFIISQNKCVEVKSDFILKKRTKGPYKKQKAGKKLGYEYEIRVYNEKGDIIEMYN